MTTDEINTRRSCQRMLFSKKKQCGVACVAASVIIVYGVVCGIANAIRRGKQNGRY